MIAERRAVLARSQPERQRIAVPVDCIDRLRLHGMPPCRLFLSIAFWTLQSIIRVGNGLLDNNARLE
jgi:hypothetical protein